MRSFYDRPRVTDLAPNPFVTITLWDHDPSGSNDCLGTCKVYLSDITGTMDGVVKPLKRITISRRKSRWTREFQELDAVTRVYAARLPVKQNVKPEVKSSLQVEVRGDHPPSCLKWA